MVTLTLLAEIDILNAQIKQLKEEKGKLIDRHLTSMDLQLDLYEKLNKKFEPLISNLKRQLKRDNERLLGYVNKEKLSKHGYQELGYLKGKIHVRELVIDILEGD